MVKGTSYTLKLNVYDIELDNDNYLIFIVILLMTLYINTCDVYKNILRVKIKKNKRKILTTCS